LNFMTWLSQTPILVCFEYVMMQECLQCLLYDWRLICLIYKCFVITPKSICNMYVFLRMCNQARSRSAASYMPSDQNLHSSLLGQK
jgi:hypothetical protein